MNRKAYIAQLEQELARERNLRFVAERAATVRLDALRLAASVADTGSSPSYVVDVARQFVDFIGATS